MSAIEERVSQLERHTKRLRESQERIQIPIFDSSGAIVALVEGLQAGANIAITRQTGDKRRLAVFDIATGAGVTNGDAHDHSGGDGAQIDHGGLAGLSDDDHTIYALDTDLTAHLNDTSDAHDASAVSIVDAGGLITATEVEAALQEIAATNRRYRSITFVIDGGGSTITTGIKGDLEIPFACTIQRVTMLADQSGSIVVDIWKDTYANYPPTDADSITASAVPTISSATKSQDATLTGWTTSITAGDTLRFNVDSATTIQRVTISLRVLET